MKKIFALLVFCVFPAWAAPACAAEYRVISVADGDTITILTPDRGHVKIRLYGIDCPERDQAFGNRARRVTKRAVHGKNVAVLPVDKDRYGRTVAVVTVDGENINAMLVRAGMAWVDPKYCTREDVCAPLRRMEATAKSERRGIWRNKEPVPPWEWKKSGQRISLLIPRND